MQNFWEGRDKFGGVSLVVKNLFDLLSESVIGDVCFEVFLNVAKAVDETDTHVILTDFGSF